jgi:hypothetical protein
MKRAPYVRGSSRRAISTSSSSLATAEQYPVPPPTARSAGAGMNSTGTSTGHAHFEEDSSLTEENPPLTEHEQHDDTNNTDRTDTDTFLNASRTMMTTSRRSLLDDSDHENGHDRLPSTTMYPRLSTARSTSSGENSIHITPTTTTSATTSAPPPPTAAARRASAHANTRIQNQHQQQQQDSFRSNIDDGYYSDDSAVKQARQHMEEHRTLHPVQLPRPEELRPPPPTASRILVEPPLPVHQSSRRVLSVVGTATATYNPASATGGASAPLIRRRADLVRGTLYVEEQANDTANANDIDMPHHGGGGKSHTQRGNIHVPARVPTAQQQQPVQVQHRPLRPNEMVVRCESCLVYLQLCKSAIVVQCPACGVVSLAKSTLPH